MGQGGPGGARSAATAGAVVALLLAVSGCASDEGGSDLPDLGAGSTSSTPPPTTTSAAPTSTGAATSAYPDVVPTVTEGEHRAGPSADPLVAAVVGYERALVESLYAGRVANEVATVATGDALADVTGRVRQYTQSGWTLRGALTVAVSGASIDGRTAAAEGCIRDATMAYEGERPVQEPTTAFFAFTAQLTQRGTSWTVSDLNLQSRGSCAV